MLKLRMAASTLAKPIAKRLVPSAVCASVKFGEGLRAAGVLCRLHTSTPRHGIGPMVMLIPECCAELYRAWIKKSSPLHKLDVDTVVKLAADVWQEEAEAWMNGQSVP